MGENLGPGLSRKDSVELEAGMLRVLSLMRDNAWHDATEIRAAAGAADEPASEGLRRMRQLRQRGYVVEKRRKEGRLFEYRMCSQIECRFEAEARITVVLRDGGVRQIRTFSGSGEVASSVFRRIEAILRDSQARG